MAGRPQDRVALVAGATRGAGRGIPVGLGEEGATCGAPSTSSSGTSRCGSTASLPSGALAQVYGFTDVDGTQPDAWRHLVEVQESDRRADDTGYR